MTDYQAGYLAGMTTARALCESLADRERIGHEIERVRRRYSDEERARERMRERTEDGNEQRQSSGPAGATLQH